MGFLTGSASFVRYRVEGELPENFMNFVAERVASFSFRDIDDTFDEYSVGWVSVSNMFDSSFRYASYQAGDFIILTLRVDERKISSAVLKKMTAKEEERVKLERELPRLSRGHRMEIKENVRLMLMKKAVPVPAVYDLAWNLAESTLTFFSTNKKAQAVLEDFFKECFELRLILQIPYLTAFQLLGAEEEEKLAAAAPAIFL